jgi:excisionase family DNA binding protein
MGKLLTTSEVAALLRISEGGVYRYVRQGLLRATKPTGQRLLFREQDLQRLLMQRAAQGQARKGA